MSGNLIIVTAPSGAGKTSLVKSLLESDSQVKLSISYTTRPPRPGEVDGVDYHFVDIATFETMLGHADFLEHAQVHGNYYGTSQAWINAQRKGGQDILLEIDWQGAKQVRLLIPETIGIFILPPSLAVLEERLRNRAQDSEEVIQQRLHNAVEEMKHVAEFDYVMINQDFAATAKKLHSIICAERCRTTRVLSANASLVNQLTSQSIK